MFNVRKRLGASILLTLSSIVTICFLLSNNAKVKQLQRVTLGTTIEYSDLWKWGSGESDLVDGEEEDNGNGVRLVILGDSWVDDLVEEGHGGKGDNWPSVLCDEINCTSRLNFAASQPSDAWPSTPPTGAMTSNEIHEWSISQNQLLRSQDQNYTAYPDLAVQIQTFISLPQPKTQPQETIFIVSFGFWDIYDFAQLDFPAAQNATDTSIDFLFDQLDILYTHFATNLYPATTPLVEVVHDETTNTTSHSTSRHKFKVIIPRIFDPTLLPGWFLQRPVPAAPANIAEQQKNAVYLTQRWNQGIENKMGAWMDREVVMPGGTQAAPTPTPSPESPETTSRTDVRESKDVVHSGLAIIGEQMKHENSATEEIETKKNDTELLPKKDIYYHDSASLLTDLIIEHQLEDEGISDASGLGEGESPFESVSMPCLRPQDVDDDPLKLVEGGWRELNGMLVCRESEMYMWWDAFNLGSKGKEMVGKAVAEILKQGKSLRSRKEEGGK